MHRQENEIMRTHHLSMWLATIAFILTGITAKPLRATETDFRTPPSTYALEVHISRDGKTLASPRITVLNGIAAQMRLVDPAYREGGLRVEILTTPAARTASGASSIDIQAIVMEQIAGAWVVAGEPSVRAEENQPATLAIDGNAGRLEIQVRASPGHDPRGIEAMTRICPPLNREMETRAATTLKSDQHCPQLPCPGNGKDNCCTAPRTDGSGRSMTCCGAITCCEGVCGACCSPMDNAL
ncbi:hypothetical protein EBB59_05590 [Lysobacter pythonis]|uniref:Uncharacterized protein n=1 Tax=Solilutibacter pythonis TaxID=2483112 RepID=A0A3M2I520_9GAMM|nr:hypothetical protein [Lysobacter pythonis]RMH93354.1 hypothetical protein EBB59_05590 [Lysobacter pythonis]